ncbi:MAG TPA: DeoR/GlpR family DNA-binding transcription regulator [Nocardioidaceae bacterium]|nr:DeoR/GlpR family DNA-binding transcription regulator [Nocardioidaceae bacterium]
MYAEERQHAIADLVTRDRRVSVSEAAEAFGVTTETVRRDLAVLERQGVIHRVHGGAVPAQSLTMLEPAVAERDVTAAEQKDRIARAALDLLPRSGGSVILDGGTTTGRLAALLPSDRALTVITNAAPIAAIVTAHTAGPSQLELHILGGRVRPVSQVSVGAAALGALRDLRVDVSFIGVNAFSLDHGLLTPNHDEAAVKSAMIEAGRRVVVLADSTKFGIESMVRFGRLEQIDAVVTDDGVPDATAQALEALDIDVVIA